MHRGPRIVIAVGIGWLAGLLFAALGVTPYAVAAVALVAGLVSWALIKPAAR